ncbi:hypothetical protein [Cetobacterium sp. 2A]|nr:hypothetical protein [Cetobacterium sp. 2A]
MKKLEEDIIIKEIDEITNKYGVFEESAVSEDDCDLEKEIKND